MRVYLCGDVGCLFLDFWLHGDESLLPNVGPLVVLYPVFNEALDSGLKKSLTG
jgi:hypothetical protein